MIPARPSLGRVVSAFVLAVLVWTAGAAAMAQPKFPPLTGRVVDGAHILSPAAIQQLDGKLAALEQQTGRQLVVATVPDLQGYEIEDYGYQLGRTWGLGRKDVNDGAILLVAPTERKVRIEVGYGLEPVLTDALSSVILQQAVLPAFKQSQMEQGVIQGADALIQQLSLPDDQARANVAQAAQAPQRSGGDGGIAPVIIFLLFIVFWVIGGLAGGRRGRRGGGSGALWWLLPLLFSGGGGGRGGGGWGGGGGGGGGFSGGGGSFGGGGSSGSW